MPLDPLWKDVARELPDARTKRAVGEKQHRLLGWMEPVFCVNCGAPGGMISKEWAAHVFHLCDACVGTFGPPPGSIEIPDAIARDPSTAPPAVDEHQPSQLNQEER